MSRFLYSEPSPRLARIGYASMEVSSAPPGELRLLQERPGEGQGRAWPRLAGWLAGAIPAARLGFSGKLLCVAGFPPPAASPTLVAQSGVGVIAGGEPAARRGRVALFPLQGAWLALSRVAAIL
ncbi:UNVERIFIED_CONTAM: hypothetical protein K2H54_017923 [Gekko kuhli]